jgi:3-hydroxyacyl-[acyl-carrier-protein] dehydratase
MEWYLIKKIFFNHSEKISATVTVPGNSPWFSGHFPGNPILPAIAQISIVFDIICQAVKKPILLNQFHRVKFRRIILPDEEMDITASQINETSTNYSFQISVNGELACKGMMHTDEPANK